MKGSIGLGIAKAGAGRSVRRTDFSPALVIGSGFGGAVAALRLGQAGIDTLVLERGRRWPITADGNTFATFEKPDGRAAWLSPFTAVALIEQKLGIPPPQVDVFAGVLEPILGNGVNIAAGAGVGGGSLVYNAISVQPRREQFQRIFPASIDYDEMDAVYYPRVRSILRPSPIPPDILATPFYQSTRVNFDQAQRAGFETRPVDLAVDWDIVREEIAGTKAPSAIAGQSWYGLNSGAKRSLDGNYLAMAEQTGHVEIRPLHVVDAISEHQSDGLYVVSANVIDEHGCVLGRREFGCRYLFLAAGSVGTSGLLVRSQALGGLPRLPAEIGRHWGTNGDFEVVRAGGPATNPGTGGPAGHFIAEDLLNPFGPTSMVELVTPRHLAIAPGIVAYVGMGAPPAVGEIRYDSRSDRTTVNWPAASDSRLTDFLRASQGMVDLLNVSNSNAQFQPTTILYDPTLVAHPLGGAVVGRVCNQYGRVKGHPRLYVVDGAFIPGSSGLVNPSMTIAALAERSVEHILAVDMD